MKKILSSQKNFFLLQNNLSLSKNFLSLNKRFFLCTIQFFLHCCSQWIFSIFLITITIEVHLFHENRKRLLIWSILTFFVYRYKNWKFSKILEFVFQILIIFIFFCRKKFFKSNLSFIVIYTFIYTECVILSPQYIICCNMG